MELKPNGDKCPAEVSFLDDFVELKYNFYYSEFGPKEILKVSNQSRLKTDKPNPTKNVQKDHRYHENIQVLEESQYK